MICHSGPVAELPFIIIFQPTANTRSGYFCKGIHETIFADSPNHIRSISGFDGERIKLLTVGGGDELKK